MISDRIAKRLVLAHKVGKSIDKIRKATFDSLISDIAYNGIIIGFENKATLECEVVSDPVSQQIGLQKYASLPDGYGMAFTFMPSRYAAFHMATVAFPIDMIFVDDNGRVAKTVEDVQPGEDGVWGNSNTSMVIEANAGFCAKNHITLGSRVSVLHVTLDKSAGSLGYMPAWFDMKTREVHQSPGGHVTFMLKVEDETGYDFDEDRYVSGYVDTKGRFYTREQMHRIVKSPDPFYTSEELYAQALENADNKNVNVIELGFVPIMKTSQERFPDYPLKSVNPKMIIGPDNVNNERFKNRDTVDVQLNSQQADPSNYDSMIGHDPSIDTIETSVTRPN